MGLMEPLDPERLNFGHILTKICQFLALLYILGKCGAIPRRIFLDFGQLIRSDLGCS